MSTQGIMDKIKVNLDEAKKIAKDLDRDKVKHLWDQAAQVGIHEVSKARKNTQSRFRLARIELRKRVRDISSEKERLEDLAKNNITTLRDQFSEVISTEKARWRGKSRSS